MSALSEFERLISIMNRLRKECPWDRKQTPESLRQYILEEAYEVIDAIDHSAWDNLKNELGDLLLQIIFQAKVGEERNRFNLEEVIHTINEKLIRRHPHVFGNIVVKDAEEVKENWEQIKLNQESRKSILDGIPQELSSLLRAQRIQEKASNVGFDWREVQGTISKIREELLELENAISEKATEEIENELGDLLFSVVNLARFQKVNAEDALRKTIHKFISRFQYIEKNLAEKNKTVYNSTLEEMDELWEKSKKT
jgi:MazG family protein